MKQPYKHVAFCPHCGNRSPQRIAYKHTYQDTWYSEDGKQMRQGDGPESEAILCICETCDAVLLYDGVAYSESGNWPELAYPRGASLPDSVPSAVRGIYGEAAKVKQNAPNAYAMLIRKGIEAVCDDQGAPDGTLAARLKHLSDHGNLPPVLAELTDVLRVVGNTAAHGSLQTITAPMTWAIDDFFRAVVEYVYVAPSKLAEFKQRLSKVEKTQS